jgi:endoglucanase
LQELAGIHGAFKEEDSMLGLQRRLSLGTAISLTMLGMGTVSGCSGSSPAAATGVDAGVSDPSARSGSFAYAASLGRGINLGNALEAPKEGDWGVILTDADFDLVQSAGFNHVRIPVRFSAHADVTSPYTLDPAFLNRVDWAIQSALDRGLKAIVDLHNEEDLFANPDTETPRFLGIWKQLAEHYAAFPQGLAFEILNEPHGAVDAEMSNNLTVAALAVIRESNPNRMVIVAPAGWSHVEGLPSLVLPDSDPSLIATFHYYDPMTFTHQGASETRVDWPGAAGDQTSMVAQFDTAAQWSRTQNRPVYVGEFGTIHFADIDARARWTAAVVSQSDAHQFPYAYWELRSEFGVWDPTVKAWHKEIIDAILPGNSIPPSAETTGNCAPMVIPDSPNLRIDSLAWTNEDYVQSSPAAPVPDQVRDLKVEVTIGVGVRAFLVMSVDKIGKAAPIKGYVAEWDTIVDDSSPLSVLCTQYSGIQTWAIAVVENGAVLNTASGELPLLTVNGERQLALHLGDPKSLEGSGAILRVFAVTANGDLVASAPWPTNF